jgi:hypothetical protein
VVLQITTALQFATLQITTALQITATLQLAVLWR